MSDKRAIIALVVVVAFAGIFGASQAGMFALTDANPTTATTMRYLGHVTAVVSDSNGNIKSYFQTDNKVVNDGRNCATRLIFGISVGASDCAVVRFMAIGSDTTVSITDSVLGGKTDNGNVGPLTASFTDPASGGDNAVLEYTNTFEIDEEDTVESIGVTGLFDANNNMFGKSTIGPIPVTPGDKLDIEWTLSVE